MTSYFRQRLFCILLTAISLVAVSAVNEYYFAYYSIKGQSICFYTDGSSLSWSEAREFCHALNSTLPIITDENIQKAFEQFVTGVASDILNNNYVWIGAHAQPVSSNDPWRWINGQQSDLSIFHGGYQGNAVSAIGLANLYDLSWTTQLAYICQYHHGVNCSAQWTLAPKQYVLINHEHRQSRAETLEECQTACVIDPACVAVTVRLAATGQHSTYSLYLPGQCWLKRDNGGTLQPPSDIYRLYELTRQCNVSSETACDGGFIYNSTCYKIHNETKVSWFTAVNRCLADNASLASFDDSVRSYFSVTQLWSAQLWIGLHQRWWTWPDGADVLYNKFNASDSSLRPNSDYDCAVAADDWRGADCSQKHRVVCQYHASLQGDCTTISFTPTKTGSELNSSTVDESVSESNWQLPVIIITPLIVAIIIIVALIACIAVYRRRANKQTASSEAADYVNASAQIEPYYTTTDLNADRTVGQLSANYEPFTRAADKFDDDYVNPADDYVKPVEDYMKPANDMKPVVNAAKYETPINTADAAMYMECIE